jgi:hypothetical protein
MKERFVGFYWTLPVRWAGFTQLASDAKTAAAESTTIRYQRTLIQQYVAENGDELVGEIAALETSPDRATEFMKPEIAKAKSLCQRKSAKLLWVDFGSCGWRPHHYIQDAIGEYGLPNLALEAVPVLMQGKWFDPRDHFRTWRDSEEEERAHRKDFVLQEFEKALAAEPDTRGRYGRIAERLNAAGVPTLGGGKEWKVDNVKKVVAARFKEGKEAVGDA